MLSKHEAAERLMKRLRTLHDRLSLSLDEGTRQLVLAMLMETRARLDQVLESPTETQFASSEIDFDRPIPGDPDEQNE